MPKKHNRFVPKVLRHQIQSRTSYVDSLICVAPQFEIQEGKVCSPYTRLSFPLPLPSLHHPLSSSGAGRSRNRRNDSSWKEKSVLEYRRAEEPQPPFAFHRRSYLCETLAMRRRLRQDLFTSASRRALAPARKLGLSEMKRARPNCN